MKSIVSHPLLDSGGSPPESVMDFHLHGTIGNDCPVELAMELNDRFHSVLPDTVKSNLLRNKRKVFYALEYDGRYYAAAIWTDPVAANRLSFDALELRRLAIADDAPKNTATRMLAMMRRDIKKRWPELRKIISYQAVDHHHGTIYKADNWTQSGSAEFNEWSTSTRKRALPQTRSAKIRWERNL